MQDMAMVTFRLMTILYSGI